MEILDGTHLRDSTQQIFAKQEQVQNSIASNLFSLVVSHKQSATSQVTYSQE